jgi:hypothetical protein
MVPHSRYVSMAASHFVVTAVLCLAGIAQGQIGGSQVAVAKALMASQCRGALPVANATIAAFSADITIPAGHRCMGILPTLSMSVDDPLEAHGFILKGQEAPIVLVALDWCEVRNGAYDEWRDALAAAAGTTRERVLVCSLHQHDAPVIDSGAQEYLDQVGLPRALYDREFHSDCIRRVVAAAKASMAAPIAVTHVAHGQAEVQHVASSRRVVYPDGRITYDRGSSSARDPFFASTDEGLIDPLLKTISFWNGDQPILALHSYATHPMSSYGNGRVSADFVGRARRQRLADDPKVAQIYVSGCSGDVTAGKYNNGAPEMRSVLADRLHQGMKRAWDSKVRTPLEQTSMTFRSVPLVLPFNDDPEFARETLLKTLNDDQQPERERILAAMSLSSRDRVDRGQPIDVPCIDFGVARIVLMPGESFVGYQLLAQQLSGSVMTLCIGYGECWPGYIPTQEAFDDGFNHDWRWVSNAAAPPMKKALSALLKTQ